jgi:hypothetical protein
MWSSDRTGMVSTERMTPPPRATSFPPMVAARSPPEPHLPRHGPLGDRLAEESGRAGTLKIDARSPVRRSPGRAPQNMNYRWVARRRAE